MNAKPTGDGRIRAAVLPVLLLLVAAGALSAGCTDAGAQSPPATVYLTEDYPPFNYDENGTARGITVDLLLAAAEITGDSIDADTIRFVPWSEGYRQAVSGQNTILFSTVRLAEREDEFLWAGPIASEAKVLFACHTSGVTVRSPADLSRYRIGVVTDDAAVGELAALGIDSGTLITADPATLAGMLQAGEIDLWCYGRRAGEHVTSVVCGNSDAFVPVYTLTEYDLYYAFSTDTPPSTVEAFQEAIDIVKTEEDAAGVTRYDRILADYLPAAQLSSLRYITEEFPPLNYHEDGSAQGIAVDILEELFHRYDAGISVGVCEFLPWEQGYRAALTGPRTVLFSTARVPSRDGLFHWAGPYAEGSLVLFAPAEKHYALTSPDDLAALHIGVIANTSSIPRLRAIGVPEESIVTGENAEVLVQMLEAGTIDAWSTGDLSGRYLLRQYAAHPDAYIPVYTLGTNEYYFAFSPDTPEALVATFQQGIEEIKNEPGKNGTPLYQEILYRHAGAGYLSGNVTKDAVIAVVDRCAEGIAADAPGTTAAINAGEPPFVESNDTGLYPFVYDVNTTIVADGGNPLLVGTNLSGKADAAGYAFRDAIVSGALANGTGWVEYVWTHPEHASLYHKATYYRCATGSDGITYIVCAGMYSQKPDV